MRLDLADIVLAPVTDPRWLVKDMIPRGSFVVLAGEHGTGKSSLLYHLCLCAPLGKPFLGHQTFPTDILYLDEENGKPDATRYWQWTWRGLGCPDPQLWAPRIRFENFSLASTTWARQVREYVQESPRPGLIVIDTATPALRIIDENDNAEASQRILELRSIQTLADNETSVIVLKHEKTRDDVSHRRTVRGAKAWLGAADIVMYLSFKRGGSHGLRRTILAADKPRAFGLQYPLEIIPKWTTDHEPRGLILNAQRAVAHHEED